MINNKTYLPHTYENQAVLREYGEKIANRFGKQAPLVQKSSLWDRICGYFPTSQSLGYKAGSQLALTYGAQWSNSAIDLVAKHFFQTETKPLSYWDKITSIFYGATEKTVAETLKLTLTPKALPYITFMTGTVGSMALPTLVSLISLTYQKAMFDPRKLQQLSELPIDRLFTVDPETGRLRDAFGRLMSPEDMKDIFAGAAKYDLICKLIELCHQVDQIDADDDVLQEEIYNKVTTLAKSYMIERSDGQLMFPDGSICTEEEKEIIHKGISDLSRINPHHKAKKIRKFIRLLAKHSLLPVETLSLAEEIGLKGSPKRMPAIFPPGEQAWKNAIIRTQDGKYLITQDIEGKKKGTIISKKEIPHILKELQAIQDAKAEHLEGFVLV
jgi:hypothetical protein